MGKPHAVESRGGVRRFGELKLDGGWRLGLNGYGRCMYSDEVGLVFK